MSEPIRIESTEPVMEIVLDRPKTINAMNPPLIEALDQAIERAKEPQVRAMLIRGEGRGFCAGGDIGFFAQSLKSGAGVPREMPERLHKMIENLNQLQKPVIAAVHGPCAGAGMSLALACDLVVAADDAKFNMAYVGIGLSPDGSSTYFLPRHVGLKKAMEIFLLPRAIPAAEALEMGLINRVLPAAELLTETRKLAEKLAAGPTVAYGNVKRALASSFYNNLHDQLELESDLVCTSGASEDFKAGVTAFLEKKSPKFIGQ